MKQAYEAFSIESKKGRSCMLNTLASLTIVQFFLTTAACAEKAENTPVHSTPSKYTWVEENTELPSDDSPMGYWEQRYKYPTFIGDNASIARLNNIITTQRELHSCSQGGDTSFEVTVHASTDQIVSLSYEQMWMCSTMPRPDSTWGALTYSFARAESVNLTQELESKEAQSQLTAYLSKNSPQDCEVSITSYAIEAAGITFFPQSYTHGDSNCKLHVSSQIITPLLKPDSELNTVIASISAKE